MPPAARKWDQRIERARELAEAHSSCAEILSFYRKVAAFQGGSYSQLQSSCGPSDRRSDSLPAALDDVDLALLMTRWSPFLSLIGSEAPASLAEFARDLKPRGNAVVPGLLRAIWPGARSAADQADEQVAGQVNFGSERTADQTSAGAAASPEPLARFCAQAFLQPYAEFLADRAAIPVPTLRRPICPYCGSPPLLGVLRQEGDGARRSLVCSFCRTEWDYVRIACPACEERREEKLCVYGTPAFDNVRVEACDTCRAYIKTVDLTRSGLAVPEVDELAAIPLTLWADEKGYRKVARNVVGL